MEFVKGKDLEQLGPQAKALFEGADGSRLFRDMGRLVCLDIVTNNWDRLPIIWNNEGIHNTPRHTARRWCAS
jgi:hypothetical protein